MAKIITWDTPTAKKELSKRLGYCKEGRRRLEYQWEENERTLYNTRGQSTDTGVSASFESEAQVGITEIDQGNSDVGINYAFKNYRLIHSQLSSNPPSVVARPTSNDPSDRRKADAADRLIRFAIRHYKTQEIVDLASANCLQYGTGVIKTIWDPEKGDIMDIDTETGDIIMDGDISFTVPSPWDLYVDPDATMIDDIRYVFERIAMPFEEALFRFGEEKRDILEKYRVKEDTFGSTDRGNRSALDNRRFDVVEIYQYWERGLPHNGMIGRFCYLTRDGDPLTPVGPNPFRFAPPKDHGVSLPGELGESQSKRELPGKAYLPYHFFTDIDVPGSIWGRSFVSYEAPLQDLHNRLMNVTVDCLQAHGVARIILPEGAEIADDSITNSPWDIVKYTGNIPPSFMEPMPLPASMDRLIEQVKMGIDDMAGVNEAMFGQQSRETSGFSMQYATNQGNMIRRRLFNKYVLFVESLYKAFLNLARKHWNESRMIWVLGTEKAFESQDIKGADIDGGFDLVVEYGASLSLDPTTRREEILTMQPLFEQAGVDSRTILKLLKLNELEGAFDIVQMADDRQREIFEEMIATGRYIEPRELQDHQNMLKFAYQYVMTTEYKYLPEDEKQLIDQHIKAREMLAAQGAAPAGGTPGPTPQPGGLSQLPGGEPMDVMAAGPEMIAGG